MRPSPSPVHRPLAQVWLVLAGLAVCSACSPPEAPAVADKTRPVRVLAIQPEQRPVLLRYIGATSSQSIKKYSFKMAGRVQAIAVDKGQAIRRGQLLARLDPKDLNFALEASKLTQIKAEEALANARSLHGKLETLFRQQARSQLEYDKAKLNLEVAQASARQAGIDVEHKQSVRADTALRSEVDGFVVEVLNKVGEVVGAGYPVVVVRNDVQVVKVGVAQRDLRQLQLGTAAQLDVDGARGRGQVINIAQIPDLRSRTYDVEIELTGPLAERDFYLGAIARVAFEVGRSEGVWIPIQAILTDGVDHAFVAESGRAVRRNLQLGAISGTHVQVEGLGAGEQLIVEGMKNLKEGYQVAVLPGRPGADEDGGAAQASGRRAKEQ